MCLDKARKVNLKRNIRCYKVLEYDSLRKKLYSPFQYEDYDIGETKEINAICPDIYSSGDIHGNAYHTYKRKRDAIRECRDWGRFCVVKCIIPKDSKYVYKGVCCRDKSYASQKLIVKKSYILTKSNFILNGKGRKNQKPMERR